MTTENLTQLAQLVRNALGNAIEGGYRDELVTMTDAIMVQDLYDTDAEIEAFVNDVSDGSASFMPLVDAVITVRRELGI